MRATWKFRACKLRSQYSWIQRKGHCNTITGNERDALEFARRCVEHFQGQDVTAVEAWSVSLVEGVPDDVPGLLTFRVVPHENGKDWSVLPCTLQHPCGLRSWSKELTTCCSVALVSCAACIS